LIFSPEETADSFWGNALIKARALFELTSRPALADDSGICVEALGGAPGVHSARYGNKSGTLLDDLGRNNLLLEHMYGKEDRRCKFVCCMILYLGNDRFFSVQETLEGQVLLTSAGNGGFGYDPLVYVPKFGCSVAELSEAEKNRISHRAKAARTMAKLIDEVLSG